MELLTFFPSILKNKRWGGVLHRIGQRLVAYAYVLPMVLWLLIPIASGISRYLKGGDKYNNYRVFKHTFWHLWEQLSLYGPYPQEYWDLNHYGPFFGLFIAPFAVLPDWAGLPLWLVVNAMGLFFAIRLLPVHRRGHLLLLWLSMHELNTAIVNQQFNIGIAAIIICTFVLLEKGYELGAAFMIALGTMTKLYGVVGLAFFFFCRRKLRFIVGLVAWMLGMFLAPMLLSSPQYILDQYGLWLADLSAKNAANAFALMQNISLLGMVRKISGDASYSDMWLILGGLVLFGLPYLRLSQYRYFRFRMMLLASVLLFTVLFSTGSESCSYIIAMCGGVIWYIVTPSETKRLNNFLLLLLVLLTGLSSSGIFPFYRTLIVPYALKALPCALIWFKLVYEMCMLSFQDTPPSELEQEGMPVGTIHKPLPVDLVLPCYNPPPGWIKQVVGYVQQLQRMFPAYHWRVVMANDGSIRNFGPEEEELLSILLPESRVVGYTKNQGKGHALRTAVATCKAPFIIYTDYDFPYQLDSIGQLLAKLEQGYDVVMASRSESYYKQLSRRRRLYSRLVHDFNNLVLHLPVQDTQGGLKGFNQKGKRLFLSTRVKQFLFDTEFIYRANRDQDIRVGKVEAHMRTDLHMSDMGYKTLGEELWNAAKILTI